jgi:hypothetical protein
MGCSDTWPPPKQITEIILSYALQISQCQNNSKEKYNALNCFAAGK